MAQAGDRTLADYVAIAISPVLIMALVGSLVFFLVEVLYVGQYQGTLLYILFFFIFGAVLVSRMSMTQEVAGRAGLYGLALGGLTWVALQHFVEYPAGTPAVEWGWALHGGFIVLIWWCAHRLTWDCTMIEDEEDASGAGLLQAAGLEQAPAEAAAPAADEPEAERKPKRRKPRDSALAAWGKRYLAYRAGRKKRPRTPGVWVVYFSLAALPLYGLGQSLIPPADVARRRSAFWLLTVYVASGLGLLLTTCFLGLRRYLRQRKVKMPAAMTGVWLLTGTALVVLFLALGALLPRPSAEYALIKLPWLPGSQDREASRAALRGSEPGKGEGRAGPEGEKEEEPGAAGEKEGTGRQGGKGGTGREGSRKGGTKGGRTSGREGRGGGREGDRGPKGEKRDRAAKASGSRPGEKSRDQRAADNGKDQGNPQQPGGSPPPSPPVDWAALGRVLKWVVLAVLVVLVAFVLLRALLSFLANFTGWARRLLDSLAAFWRALWGGAKAGAAEGEADAAEAGAPPPAPFRSFADPFQTGRAEGMPVTELVRYSFEALEAWAQERNLGRQPGETPLEFADRLAAEAPALEEDVRRLAGYYAGLAYARLALGDDCREPLRRFWLLLVEVAERPLSAGAAR